jgi:hypothetical protein
MAPPIQRLQRGDTMLRFCLSVSKVVPYLKEMEKIIGDFRVNLTEDV